MFNDIKLIDDSQVKNIQTFNIKCYSDEEFLKIKDFFKTKKKSVDFEDVEVFFNENTTNKQY